MVDSIAPHNNKNSSIPGEEGQLKYTAEHTQIVIAEPPGWEKLNKARNRLFALGLVGANSCGIGFGNLSMRLEKNKFLISGTATGVIPELTINEYCIVTSFDIHKNHVVSSGAVQASSEAMTHGAIYSSNAKASCVIHIHNRAIFDGMKRGPYAATPQSAAYGTPEIAIAIGKCAKEDCRGEGVIILLGHDEGVVAYGPTFEKTFSLIQGLYNKYAV